MDGVLLTAPLAAEIGAKLDQCVSTLDEEKRHGAKLLQIEKDTCAQREAVLTTTAKEREALLQAQIQREQKRTQEVAAEAAQAETGQVLWAVGGAVGGLLVGAIVGGVAVLYLAPGR